MELSLTHNCQTRNAEVGGVTPTDTEDPGRHKPKRSCTKKKQSDPNDSYLWY